MNFRETLKSIGIIPVIQINDAKKAVPLALALKKGGLPAAEVTFRTDAAEEAIRRIKVEVPDVCVCAGTVLNVKTAERAVKAGASAIISPGTNPEVVRWCIAHRVPVIPGCSEPLRDGQEALEKAISFGFPVILKAAAGGGGRGMRLCEMPEDVIPAFELVKSEARKAFGNDDIFIEKYLVQPKHIEVQILADQYGNVRHLGERDCSLQRRYQKVVEFAPAWSVPESIRELVKAGELSAGHARVLAGLADESRQLALAERAVREGMSVRELEKLAAQTMEKPAKPEPKPLPSELNDMQERLQNVLGVRTALHGNLKKGKIILQYDSAEELEAIYEAMERLENE